MAEKPSLQKDKSAENLKLRLASALSAKLGAANKDGKIAAGSSTINSTRSIGYLLQRKQQQNDNRLNTKQLSLGKPLASAGRVGEATGKSDGSEKEGKSPSLLQNRTRGTASQKLLLNALMSSRQASGTNEAKSDTQTTKPSPTRLSAAQTAASSPKSAEVKEAKNITKHSAVISPPTSPKNMPPNNTDNFAKLLQEIKTNKALNSPSKTTPNIDENRESQRNNLTNLTRPEAIVPKKISDLNSGNKQDLSENQSFGKKSLIKPPILATNISTGITNTNSSANISNDNGNEQTFKEKMSTFEKKNSTSTTDNDNSWVDDSHGKTFQEKRSAFENELRRKQQELVRSGNNAVQRTKTNGIPGNSNTKLQNLGKQLTGGNRENSKTESFADELARVQNARKSGNSIGSSRNSSTSDESARNINNGIQNLGNKDNRSLSPRNSNNEISSTGNVNKKTLSPRTSSNGMPNFGNSKIPPKVAPKPNRSMSSPRNSNISTKEDQFQEVILEQLEADVGNSKIAVFKVMEDFSVLRMRIHRLQGSVEEWKKARERRSIA